MGPVAQAIRERRSIRAFLPDRVPGEDVAALLRDAQWAPSGGNVQPWRVHVLIGDARDQFVSAISAMMAEDPFADESNIAVYPPSLWEPYRTRRYAIGEAMYAAIGVERDDKLSRLTHLARNYEFFGAPVGLMISMDGRMGPGQYAHTGMFLQSLCLLAHERGLGTCMQEFWNRRAASVARLLGFDAGEQLYCGVALGYPDTSHPINGFDRDRASLDEYAFFHDSLPGGA